MQKKKLNLKRGQKVRHAKHGMGVITNCWGGIFVEYRVQKGKRTPVQADCHDVVDVAFPGRPLHSCRAKYLEVVK